jgi:hypothetical protein
MVQRITSYHENESSLTHVYKGTLFSHLIDLVRFVVSLGTCLFWPAKAKMTFIVRLTRHNRTATLAVINHSRRIQNFWSRMQQSWSSQANLHCLQSFQTDLKLLKHNAEILWKNIQCWLGSSPFVLTFTLWKVLCFMKFTRVSSLVQLTKIGTGQRVERWKYTWEIWFA